MTERPGSERSHFMGMVKIEVESVQLKYLA